VLTAKEQKTPNPISSSISSLLNTPNPKTKSISPSMKQLLYNNKTLKQLHLLFNNNKHKNLKEPITKTTNIALTYSCDDKTFQRYQSPIPTTTTQAKHTTIPFTC
jgi:hypothetical protein